jgi:tyrosyl-tRNA synthetase
LLAPIRSEYEASEEWKRVAELGYPPEVKEVKVKKQKDKGDPAKREAALAAKAAALAVKDAPSAQ